MQTKDGKWEALVGSGGHAASVFTMVSMQGYLASRSTLSWRSIHQPPHHCPLPPSVNPNHQPTPTFLCHQLASILPCLPPPRLTRSPVCHHRRPALPSSFCSEFQVSCQCCWWSCSRLPCHQSKAGSFISPRLKHPLFTTMSMVKVYISVNYFDVEHFSEGSHRMKFYEVRCREPLKGAPTHTLLMIKKTITQKRIARDWTCSSGKPNTLIRARGLQWRADKIFTLSLMIVFMRRR